MPQTTFFALFVMNDSDLLVSESFSDSSQMPSDPTSCKTRTPCIEIGIPINYFDISKQLRSYFPLDVVKKIIV